MATLYTVLAAIQEQLSVATIALLSVSSDTMARPLNIEVGIGWPSERTLQNNVRKAALPTALITVFDRGLASDSTRWLPHRVGFTATSAGIQAELSSMALTPAMPVLLAFSGAVTPGDAVALVASPVRGTPFAQVAIPAPTDTLPSLAIALAGLINADPDMSGFLTAVATNGMVTLASLIESPVALQCNVGNGAVSLTEIGRRSRGLQIVVWTRTEDDRNTVGDVIETAIACMEADFGLTFPDGTMGRLKYAGDHLLNDATLSDTYRRDFLVSVDYPITVNDQLYAVLAPVSRFIQF